MKNKLTGKPGKHSKPASYDLSEEASRREDEKATTMARQLENDDYTKENNSGPPSPGNDDILDNKVPTSIDE